MTDSPKKPTAQEIEAAMRNINRTRKASLKASLEKKNHEAERKAALTLNPFANKSDKINFDKIDSYSIEALSNMHRKFKLNKEQWFKEKLVIIHEALVKKGLYYVPASKTRDSLGRYRDCYYRAYP